MSVLEQYKYDGSRKPDFQALPTLVSLDEKLMIKGAAEVPGDAAPAEAEAAFVTEPSEAEVSDEERETLARNFLKEKAAANLVEIGNLQKALHAAKKRGLIVIFQGMPYSGRTETSHYLKKAMKGGVKVYSYKRGENAHDFLWQMHRHTPKYGNICLMNSSVYADVLQVEGGAEKVRAFEKYLKASGISVVRIFLHVSTARQKKRMLEIISTKPGGTSRELPQDKGWRKEYLGKFAEVIGAATPETPWYVIPADSKWYARCLATEIVRDALRECVRAEEPAEVVELSTEPVKEVASVEAATAEATAEVPAAEAATAEATAEVATADTAPAAEPEAEKKPARRTRRKKAESPADKEGAVAEKKPARRPRRQGPPKTVEETLARRRKRMESENE